MNHRKDIQTLRAFAVVSVVIFHFFDTVLPFGYLGVDIFFVISGYLIIGGIYRKEANDDFKIIDFFKARILRLAPAYFFMLTTTIILGLLLLNPVEVEDLVESAISSILFTSNVYFWSSFNYFSPIAKENALIHTWSLSVEIQFYLILPAIILLTRKLRINSLDLLCVTLSLVSLSAWIYGVTHHPTATFYLLPGRAWQFGLGGLLAIFTRTHLFKSSVTIG